MATAAISICGGQEAETCTDVAGWASLIQQTCLMGDLVGGTYQINAGTRVEVINADSTEQEGGITGHLGGMLED